ncbi:MAG TPA: hypothetical protein VGJ95_06810 [Pseudonocardiaceae bacterium]
MSRPAIDLIAEVADALTEPHIHTEPIRYWDNNRNPKTRQHRTIQPGLLTQLYQSVTPSSSAETAAGGIPDSRPPLAVEALSRHDTITMAVLRWCRSLNLTLRVSVESNVRALVGAAATMDHDTARTLLSEMRQWQRWCNVLTGWEHIYHPAGVTCPIIECGRLHTLRINLTSSTAMCRACGATWSGDDGTITVLAAHIRAVTDCIPA